MLVPSFISTSTTDWLGLILLQGNRQLFGKLNLQIFSNEEWGQVRKQSHSQLSAIYTMEGKVFIIPILVKASENTLFAPTCVQRQTRRASSGIGKEVLPCRQGAVAVFLPWVVDPRLRKWNTFGVGVNEHRWNGFKAPWLVKSDFRNRMVNDLLRLHTMSKKNKH